MSHTPGSSVSSPSSDAAAPRRATPGSGEPLRGPTRRTAPRTAVGAVLTALVLGAMLNGSGLVSAATVLEVGPTRTVAMSVATHIEALGQVLGLDRPRSWLTGVRDGALGSALGTARGPLLPDAAAADADTAQPRELDGHAAPGAPDPARSASEMADTRASDGGTASTQSRGDGDARGDAAGEQPRGQRTITAEDPLRVHLIGDSLIGNIADGFGRLNGERNTVRWDKDVRISTGLARPDVFDWHDHLDAQLATHDPEVVVLMLGGNDDQSLVGSDTGVVHYGQDGWEAEYRRRAAQLLDTARGSDRLVVWLELPAMRPEKLEEARLRMNAAVRSAVDDTDVVRIDTGELVAPDGYTTRLDGVQIREDDGVHLTHDGGDRVAVAIDRVLREHYELPEG